MSSILRRSLLASITILLIVVLAATFRLYKLDKLPPPSLWYDEAYYGVDAIHVLNGERPIFFPGNNGREPLFIYLEAGMFSLFGISAITARLLSALIGIATVLATCWAGRELFWRDQAPNTALGLLSALCLAGLFWHISYSRYGLRVITMPFFATLTMGMLARSLRTGNLFSFALTGALIGISLYAYSIARLLPFIVVVGFALGWLSDPKNRKEYGRGLGIVILVSLVIFLPLGLYFTQHPWTFLGRAQAVWKPADLLEKIIQTFKMFSISGDTDERVNISGRPALDLFQTLIFVLGLVTCFVRRPRRQGLLVLAWLLIMLFVNLTSNYPFSFLHALGGTPAIAMTMGAGLETSLKLVQRVSWAAKPGAKVLSLGLLVALSAGLAWSTQLTFWDYFVRWPRSTDLPLAFQENLAAIGEFVRQLPADETILISPFREPPASLVFAMHGDDARVRIYDGQHCTILKDTPNKPLTYIVILSDGFSLPTLMRAMPGGQVEQTKHFTYYRVILAAPIEARPQYPAQAVFGNLIQLEGYDEALHARDGHRYLELAFYWRALKSIDQPYTLFTHLMSSDGQLVAQHDDMACEGNYWTTDWPVDEIVIDRYTLALPDDLSPGSYTLRAGIYHADTQQRLEATTQLSHADNIIELPKAIQINVP